MPGAVAVELVHNFSLMHDDVIDDDRERRHRPTVWALSASATPSLAGDALADARHAGAARRADTPPAVAAAPSLLADATGRLIAGETVDIAFETRDDVTWDECVEMSNAKTGALLGCAASIGAILAGADGARVDAAATTTASTSAWPSRPSTTSSASGARPAATGKPVWSDLRQQKKTLPVAAALAGPTAIAAELRGRCSAGQRDDEDAAGPGGRAHREVRRPRAPPSGPRPQHFDAALVALDAGRARSRRPRPSCVELARFVGGASET